MSVTDDIVCLVCSESVATDGHETPIRCQWCGQEYLHPKRLKAAVAQAWESSGFASTECLMLIAAGVSLAEAATWLTHGLNAVDLVNWHGSGYSPHEAALWKRAGIGWPILADEWTSSGFTVEEAKHLDKAGLTSPSRALEWISAGFSLDEAADWARALVRDFGDEEGGALSIALEWKLEGFDRAGFRTWSSVCPFAADARYWRDVVGDPDVARRRIERDAGSNRGERIERATPRRLPSNKRPLVSRAFSGVFCESGNHGGCGGLRDCACSCHCWHDGRTADPEQTAKHVGTNPPHFYLGTDRSRNCREELHDSCPIPTRCRCHCHCYHHDLASGAS